MKPKHFLALLAAAVLAGAAVSAWLVLRGRPQDQRADGSGGATTGPGDGGAAAFRPAARAPEWAALAPEDAVLLLGTSDLPALVAELREGPAGKAAAEPSVKVFLDALAVERAGPAGEAFAWLELGLELAGRSDGPAFLARWRPGGDGDLETALALRLRSAELDRALVLVADALKAPVAKVRNVPAGAGQVCRTAAPAGREGLAWGRCGNWLAVAGSVSGCKRMLDCLARPAGTAPAGALAGALVVAGDGRLSGCLRLDDDLARRLPAAALGWEPAGWLSYSASSGADGRWTERLVLGGRPAAGGGLLGALASGGERPALEGLPATTLACLTANVADGGRFWSELGRALEPADPERIVERSAAALAAASNRDFAKDVAPAVRGEVTVAWTLQRQALFPQTLICAGLAPGSAAKLADAPAPALELFGEGGTVESADYAGSRLSWRQGHAPVAPFCPSPCAAFQGDRLLVAGSTAPVKELLSGRGQKWLPAGDARRLGSGLLGARVDLGATMPFAMALAGDPEVRDLLPVGAAGKMPKPEELAAHLGALELVAGRSPAGLWAEVRAPAPLAALGALLIGDE